MTQHYESVQNAAAYPEHFQLAAPDISVARELRPRGAGLFMRGVDRSEVETDPGAASDGHCVSAAEQPQAAGGWVREWAAGQFGLVPPWVKSASDARLRSAKLVAARSETVSTSNHFRHAWLQGHRCIVPMMAFFDTDWRSGQPVQTRIARVDGKPMGVAGLWERWEKEGQVIISYTLLTVNANSHALMHRYQHDGNEKRMPAILSEGAYGAWLGARPEKAREFMRAYPANWLTANPVESKNRPKRLADGPPGG
jgi:putative SOS response-associated peptidase YedK